MYLTPKQKTRVLSTLRLALREDIGTGDITTEAIIPERVTIKARFVAKSEGIIAGLEVAKLVFEILDKNVLFTLRETDGTLVKPGTIIATIEGPGKAILKGERVALNFLQRMSAVATTTKSYVDAVKKTKAVILDTRKTIPTLRIFDKWAVEIGGGKNHRFGLFDMILIKDNHILAAKNITNAIMLARNTYKSKYKIEVEVRNLSELREALLLHPTRILLDNMNIDDIKKSVKITNNKIPLEVSGNVSLKNVQSIAQTGVDFISIGALTHSAKAMDISLDVI